MQGVTLTAHVLSLDKFRRYWCAGGGAAAGGGPTFKPYFLISDP